MLDQFPEYAAGAGRVDERHLVASRAGSGLLIDETKSLAGEFLEGCREIRYLEGDVMEARSSALEKATHTTFSAQRFKEFNLPDEGDPDPLGRDLLHWGTSIPGEEFVH